VAGVWVNLLGATTPELINSSLPRDTAGGGLASRIIFVYESAKGKTIPFPFIGPREMELRKKLTTDLEHIHLMVGKMKPTEGYLKEWANWYTVEHPAEEKVFDTYNLAPYYERRQTHVQKLSLILSASRLDGNMVVRKQDFKRAKEILEATEVNMPKAVSGIGRSPISEVIPRVIEYCGLQKEVTFNDLVQKFHQDATFVELESVVKTLEMMGVVTRNITGQGHVIKYLGREKRKNSEQNLP